MRRKLLHSAFIQANYEDEQKAREQAREQADADYDDMDVDYDDIPDPGTGTGTDEAYANPAERMADASPDDPDATQASGDLAEKVPPRMEAESAQAFAVSDDDDTDWHWCPQCSRPFEPDEYADHFEADHFRCRKDRNTEPVTSQV